MKVINVSNISFKRAFTTNERKKADDISKKALELLDCDKVIAIIPEASLPSDIEKNIGIGQLNSKYNEKFYDFLKTYTGANSVKVLPHGEYSYSSKKFYCNYKCSALTNGSHSINLEDLVDKGYKISETTLRNVYEGAKTNGQANVSNFENVVGSESNHTKALWEAYHSLNQLETEKNRFSKYKLDNKERVEKRALFECLQKEYGTHDFYSWPNETDKNLFNPDIVSEEIRNKRINEIKTKNPELFDFVFFKQYLAEEHLERGRELMHQKGLSLTGDCLIGFSFDEIWGYPNAFEKATICSKDWGLVSLNFADAAKEGSESNKILKLKVKQYAKHYDNIRFDVGWAYVNPILYTKSQEDAKLLDGRYVYDSKVDGYRVKDSLGDSLLKIIENTVKEVQGDKYQQKNLMYEIEAGTNDFSAYDWQNSRVIEPLRNRTIVQSTAYMNNGYATVDMLENRFKVSRDNYVIMAGNHDHLNLASLSKAEDPYEIVGTEIKNVREAQYKPLADGLRIEENKIRKTPEEFVKAKFAYNFLGKNIKMFFMDIFGRNEQFDAQNKNNTTNYRCRISSNYEAEYHRAVQEQSGLNIMDSLAKAVKAKGLDKSNKKLYKDLVKYRDILYKKGALTEEEANKSANKVKTAKLIAILSTIFVLSGICGVYLKNKFNQKKENS